MIQTKRLQLIWLKNSILHFGESCSIGALKQDVCSAKDSDPCSGSFCECAHSASWSRPVPAAPISRTCRIGWAACRRTRLRDRVRRSTMPGRLNGQERLPAQRPGIPTSCPAEQSKIHPGVGLAYGLSAGLSELWKLTERRLCKWLCIPAFHQTHGRPALSYAGTVKAAQIPYPTITSDRAIVSDHAIAIGSIVGPLGSALWRLLAHSLRLRRPVYVCRKSVNCELAHMHWG
jgi:hypothetical protein